MSPGNETIMCEVETHYTEGTSQGRFSRIATKARNPPKKFYREIIPPYSTCCLSRDYVNGREGGKGEGGSTCRFLGARKPS